MRLDGPRTNLPQYGRLVERSVSEECSDWEERSDSEEFSHSEERSDSGEFSGSEECSDSEEHSNSERPAHLELSIHEICHYRLGPALWTYRRDSDKPDLDELLMPLRWPTDILGNTFDKNCMGQMKLLAMIHEAGLLHFQNLGKDPGANFACSPDGRIFGVRLLDKEVIAMLHFSSADAGFDLVTQLPIPFTTPKFHIPSVPPAFSADGSKFAVAAKDGTVSVWDVRNKIPLMVKKPNPDVHDVYSLKFSSGTLGREVLAITEHQHFTFDAIRIRLIDSTSFEIEETLDFKLAPILRTPPERSNVLFDPDGDMMYAEQNGRLCEWKLRAREEGPDWWLGGG
ncbi:uncharacterized protein LACBIDRAFT_293553 [Laccaria bicolor S238N-H82]|uniref:Predicted protein n=1 Tax=Laccaria bicolor (strain S238N-H82 / ATCC MYA-4686) TaxID=486041 RepID=B0D453_LACBS|nr:uncharacterized protein LACBIDRAFT_293553 [Laccaria bicolor S238N-H82]EDR10514.1 predicted protein [Laccaria bicolor S238N-H82]|eukprot:XP_001878964.1 predicted protein [Laccaria bicolor S238N-H82]